MEDKFIINVKWNSNNKNGFIEDHITANDLREKYKIIAEPIGTSITSRRQNKLLIGPYILNKYDIFYLYEKNILNIESKNIEDEKSFIKEYEDNKNNINYIVYKDLHDKKDYYILPGSKYGVDFLGYKDDPNFVHSEYLITCKEINQDINVKEIINNERISVSTRKKLLFAFCDIKTKEVKYMNISWLQI